MTAALDQLLLVWALATREAGWDKLAKRSHEQVAGFLTLLEGRPELPPLPPDAPPDAAPSLAACRQAWCGCAPG